MNDKIVTTNWVISGFPLKKYLAGIPGWREIDENVCEMSSRQLIFEGPADDDVTA